MLAFETITFMEVAVSVPACGETKSLPACSFSSATGSSIDSTNPRRWQMHDSCQPSKMAKTVTVTNRVRRENWNQRPRCGVDMSPF